MSKTRILRVADLYKGQRIVFRNVEAHPFAFDPEGLEAVVTNPRPSMVEVEFVRSGLKQFFSPGRLTDNRMEVHTAPVHPSKLSRQCRILLRDLHRGHVTQRSALMDHGVMALPRRIADLKEAGYPIERVMKTNPHTGQRYASYYLAA